MRVRLYSPEDAIAVRSVHERSPNFVLPDFAHNQFAITLVVENDSGCITGLGSIRLTAEAFLIIDPEQSNRVRVLTLTELMKELPFTCQKLGLTDIHAFLTGDAQDSLSRILKSKYGFNTHSGEVLVLNI